MKLDHLQPKRLMWKIWVLILLIIVTLALMILLTIRSSITQFIDEQVYETLQDVDYYLGNTNELENIPQNPIEYDRRQQESRVGPTRTDEPDVSRGDRTDERGR
jgi:two-component system sensor histidine kinase CssS